MKDNYSWSHFSFMTRRLLVLFLALAASQIASAQNYTIQNFAGVGWTLPALSADLDSIEGLAVDNQGNVYMALTLDGVVIRVSPSGQLTLIAGNGTEGFSGDGGPAALAQLDTPTALAVDSQGNVYILDSANNRIREVSNGIINTVAGGGQNYPGDNGPATSARLALIPYGLAVDSAGNIYFAVVGGIRKVSNGTITTIGGNGSGLGDNVAATSVYVDPAGIAVDSAGNVYFADSCYNRIRKISGGIISTVAGNQTPTANFLGYNCPTGADGPSTGIATSVILDSPQSIALDGQGNVYFVETFQNGVRVREVSNGAITTFAGGSTALPFGPPVGDNIPATTAVLTGSQALAADASGNVYVPDVFWVPNSGGISASPLVMRLRKVSNGIITTIAGDANVSGDNGPALLAQLVAPTGLATDKNGNLYVADLNNNVVRKISGPGITTVAGTRTGENDNGGPAANLNLYNPKGAAVDFAGNVYIADSGNRRIVEISGGSMSAIATGVFVDSIAVDEQGNLFYADTDGNKIFELSGGVTTTIAGTTAGFADGPVATAQLKQPSGIVLDSAGDIYFTDVGNQRIRRISNGVISTIAGTGTAGFSGDKGPASSAQLNLTTPASFFPGLMTGIALDADNNIYFVDAGNQRVRRISGGIITTIAGDGTAGYFGSHGAAVAAEFNNPDGIAVDAAGTVYVSDWSNGLIRALTPDGHGPCRRTPQCQL
jgi:sugar lactone lactonase YvrE